MNASALLLVPVPYCSFSGATAVTTGPDRHDQQRNHKRLGFHKLPMTQSSVCDRWYQYTSTRRIGGKILQIRRVNAPGGLLHVWRRRHCGRRRAVRRSGEHRLDLGANSVLMSGNSASRRLWILLEYRLLDAHRFRVFVEHQRLRRARRVHDAHRQSPSIGSKLHGATRRRFAPCSTGPVHGALRRLATSALRG